MLPPTWTAMADRSLNRPPWHPGTPGLSILPKNSRTPVVVPHSNSTSNHNRILCLEIRGEVVPHSNSTSNHNFNLIDWKISALFLIPILHQTTTSLRVCPVVFRCSSFQFYIKPQRWRDYFAVSSVVPHSNFHSKITMPGNQLYTKLCNKYVANFTSLMRRENQQIQLMLILCYPVI